MKSTEDIIIEYIDANFGDKTLNQNKHYSYCQFPEYPCSCKHLHEIKYDTSLIHGGYIDSFSMYIVLLFIEETFNIKIDDIDANPLHFDTVNDITALVKKYSNK